MDVLPKDVQQIVRNYLDRYEHRVKYTRVINQYHSIDWIFYDDRGFYTNNRLSTGMMNYRTHRLNEISHGKWEQWWSYGTLCKFKSDKFAMFSVICTISKNY